MISMEERATYLASERGLRLHHAGMWMIVFSIGFPALANLLYGTRISDEAPGAVFISGLGICFAGLFYLVGNVILVQHPGKAAGSIRSVIAIGLITSSLLNFFALGVLILQFAEYLQVPYTDRIWSIIPGWYWMPYFTLPAVAVSPWLAIPYLRELSIQVDEPGFRKPVAPSIIVLTITAFSSIYKAAMPFLEINVDRRWVSVGFCILSVAIVFAYGRLIRYLQKCVATLSRYNEFGTEVEVTPEE